MMDARSSLFCPRMRNLVTKHGTFSLAVGPIVYSTSIRRYIQVFKSAA